MKRAIITRFSMIVNRAFQSLEIKVISSQRENLKPWDRFFIDCVKEHKRTRKDTNDIVDERWKNEDIFSPTYLKPFLKTGMVALEVGPGIGRYTRHVLPYCREIYLVDYSQYCCEFL
ncbi:MAG: hypothetical protein ACTSRG_19765 [Candidatus Helarchaeota archaeon]